MIKWLNRNDIHVDRQTVINILEGPLTSVATETMKFFEESFLTCKQNNVCEIYSEILTHLSSRKKNETGRNKKEQEEAERNEKKREETGRNKKKQEKTRRNTMT